jgi:hypothetical protein
VSLKILFKTGGQAPIVVGFLGDRLAQNRHRNMNNEKGGKILKCGNDRIFRDSKVVQSYNPTSNGENTCFSVYVFLLTPLTWRMCVVLPNHALLDVAQLSSATNDE